MSETLAEKKSANTNIVDNMIHNAFPPISKSNNTQCVNYKFKGSDLVLPPYEVLDTLCTFEDKTYMLIYTFIRLIIYGLIGYLVYKFLPRDPVSETIIYLFIALFIVNLIFFGFIVSKKIYNNYVSQEVGQEVGQKIGQEVGQEVGQKIGQEVGQEVGQKIGQEVGQEVGQKIGQEIGQEISQEVGQEI